MADLVREPYSVNPTPTDVVTVNTRNSRVLSGVLKNNDVSQTCDGVVLVRAFPGDDLAQSTLGDLAGIQPGEARPFSINCAGFEDVTFRLTASGAGLTIALSVRADGGRLR